MTQAPPPDPPGPDRHHDHFGRLYNALLCDLRGHQDSWRWLDTWGWRWFLNRCPHGEGPTEVHVYPPTHTSAHSRLWTRAVAERWARRQQAMVRALESLAVLVAQEAPLAAQAPLEAPARPVVRLRA